MRSFRALALFGAAMAFGLGAFADESAAAAGDEPECPADAVQALFNYQMAAVNGQITDAGQLYNVAENATRMCPDNAYVWAQSGVLYAMVAEVIADPANRLTAYSKVLNAALSADANHVSGPAPSVTYPNGTVQPINPIGQVYGALKRDVFPGMAKLAAEGTAHPMYEATALETCPYVLPGGSGLRSEAEAYVYNADSTTYDYAIIRMKSLRPVCPNWEHEVVWALAELNARSAKKKLEAGEAEKAEAYAETAWEYTKAYTALPSTLPNWDSFYISMDRIRTELKDAFPDVGNP